MKPPIKYQIGGVEESHTREYLLKISARMMGCRERSKIASKNSKNARTSAELVFLEIERERWEEEILVGGACGPQAPCGRGQGAGRASWPPGPLVAPWSNPGASGSLPAWNFFFWNFSDNFTVEKISEFKKLRNFLKTCSGE